MGKLVDKTCVFENRGRVRLQTVDMVLKRHAKLKSKAHARPRKIGF